MPRRRARHASGPLQKAAARPVLPGFKAELGVCGVLVLALISIAGVSVVRPGCPQADCARHLAACHCGELRSRSERGRLFLHPWRINPTCDRGMAATLSGPRAPRGAVDGDAGWNL